MSYASKEVPRIRLTCLSNAQCTVHVEPWGTEFVLVPGDWFWIETLAFLTGDVEVSYVEGGISVCLSSDARITVTNSEGQRLEI